MASYVYYQLTDCSTWVSTDTHLETDRQGLSCDHPCGWTSTELYCSVAQLCCHEVTTIATNITTSYVGMLKRTRQTIYGYMYVWMYMYNVLVMYTQRAVHNSVILYSHIFVHTTQIHGTHMYKAISHIIPWKSWGPKKGVLSPRSDIMTQLTRRESGWL